MVAPQVIARRVERIQCTCQGYDLEVGQEQSNGSVAGQMVALAATSLMARLGPDLAVRSPHLHPARVHAAVRAERRLQALPTLLLHSRCSDALP